jgi:uncharacterized protein YecE (DUF72 family)
VNPTKQVKTGPGYQMDVLLHIEFIVKLYAQITHSVQRLNGDDHEKQSVAKRTSRQD